MNGIAFEQYGQVILCHVEREPMALAHAYWRIDVDGVDRGVAFPALPEDSHEDVEKRVLAWLTANGSLRIPLPPWRWSVLDERGGEWWARLTEDLEPAMDPRVGRELVLLDCQTGAERRLSWKEGMRDPRAHELRRLVGRFATS